MIRFVVVEGVSRKRRNRHPAPFLDASAAEPGTKLHYWFARADAIVVDGG